MVTPVNTVSSVNGSAPYDPTQQDFLDDLQKFQQLLEEAEKNPNDPIIAAQLKDAATKLASDEKALQGGDAADKKMASDFETLTQGNLDKLLTDATSGSLEDVMNDVYGFSQNPGQWGEITEGLSAFNSEYPNGK